MFPINLVLFQMMSEVVRYEIKNFITWTVRLWKLTQKNQGRSVRKRTRTLILVEVEDEEVVELLQRLTMRDLKKLEEY